MSSLIAAVVLLHLLFCGREATAKYYIECNEGIRNQTRPKCTLARPTITYSAAQGNYVDLPGNLTLLPDVQYVVGYIKTLHVFIRLGCISASRKDLGTEVHDDIPSDPGQCFSICGGKYFGVLNSTCYCFKNILRNFRYDCIYGCFNTNTTVYGGFYLNLNYISVFEHVKVTAGRNDGNYCSATTIDEHKHFWENCSREMNGFCESASSNDTAPRATQPATWKDFVNTCFANNMCPLIHLKDPFVYVDGGKGLWTGIIRSWVIERLTDTSSTDIDNGYFGYVKAHNGNTSRLQLHFTKFNSWKFLCFREDTDIMSFTPALHTSVSPTVDLPTLAYVLWTKGLQTTTEHIPVLSTNQMSGVDENTIGSATIAVYVISPVVLTAVVVGTICFIRRKRRRKKDDYVDTGVRFENTKPTPGVTNAAYDDNSIQAGPEKVQDHNYWVLEKATDFANIDPVDDDNDYDTTTARKTRVNNDNCGNVYNTLEASSYDTYDHTVDIINKIKHNDDNDGNVYTTLEASSDNTYDLTSYTPDKIKNIDDTYNHVVKECVMANEYSTAIKWNIKQDGAHTFDDTYNHI